MKTIGIDPAPPGKAIHVSVMEWCMDSQRPNPSHSFYAPFIDLRAVLDQIVYLQPDIVVIETPDSGFRTNPALSPQIRAKISSEVSKTLAVASKLDGLLTGHLNVCAASPGLIRSSIAGWSPRAKVCRGWTADKWICESLRQQGYGDLLKSGALLGNVSKRDAGLASIFGRRLLTQPVLMLETQGRADCSVSLLQTSLS